MTAAWDKVLDWWEFTAARFLARHRRVLAALVIALAVASVIFSTWAFAQNPTPIPGLPPEGEGSYGLRDVTVETEYVIVRRSLLNDAIELIERQEAEIEALRARCPPGAAAI